SPPSWPRAERRRPRQHGGRWRRQRDLRAGILPRRGPDRPSRAGRPKRPVGDHRRGHSRFSALPASRAHGPAISYPSAPFPPYTQAVVIRTSRPDPFTLVPELRQAVRSLDANVPVYDVKTLEQQVSRSLWRQRLQGQVLGTFAGLALLLTVVGIYGVIA